MSVHLHRVRQWTACMLGAAAVSPLAWNVSFPHRSAVRTEVTGQVDLAGRPASGVILCLDGGGVHIGYAPLRADGTFHLIPMSWTEDGVRPGRYRAHLYTYAGGPQIPPKYVNPETSGIEVPIAAGWSHLHIDAE